CVAPRRRRAVRPPRAGSGWPIYFLRSFPSIPKHADAAVLLEHIPSKWGTCSGAAQSSLLLPGRERVRKGAIARRTFFQGKDRASAVGVDDRDIEPRTISEKLHVALLVGLDRGEPDQKEAVGHLHREAASGVPRACSDCFIRMPG